MDWKILSKKMKTLTLFNITHPQQSYATATLMVATAIIGQNNTKRIIIILPENYFQTTNGMEIYRKLHIFIEKEIKIGIWTDKGLGKAIFILRYLNKEDRYKKFEYTTTLDRY